ncbi:MAG TPA: DUF3427 domain-containing protein [Kofleriaceae bacterium]|nr:DUF3427 domain-containing protein [Kofleriaceae bacterium]
MSAKKSVEQFLVEGVYEHLVTEQLERALGTAPHLERLLETVDDADAHVLLARHLGREIERALDLLPSEQRAEHARALSAKLLEFLADQLKPEAAEVLREQRPVAPARRLLAIHRGGVPPRPTTPLATSTLLSSRKDPSFGHELAREAASADRIDAIIAFVTVGGVRTILDSLQQFSRRDAAQLRLLTTTFTGTTQVAALDTLARLPGAQVKISYDTRRTRLHAKAWLFHRATGLSTAYVGSANLTATALGAGHEWMVKISNADLGHVIDKFAGTFETLWEDPEFERYDPDDAAHRTRLAAALSAEVSSPDERDRFLVRLQPFPFQQEILDKLEVERSIHLRRRNLVVAATGTGKTVIAALDYARAAHRVGTPPRLLFLAHRAELLEQARRTFRYALQDASFGELLVGNDQPTRWEHVFASIQSAVSTKLLDRFGPSYFQHVVVDECHHVPARSYQELVPNLRPELLVGLTATPERADHQSLLPDFDGHIAAELRLWSALDNQLLVPFEYYGISDGTNLRDVRWTRTGYDTAALAGLYTGNTVRANLVRHQLAIRVADPRAIRALGFCVSIEHAKFMAAQFSAAGIPALAVYADSPDRERAPDLLRERAVNVLFTCDLYNEGVDLPFVDTLLLLRPTQSATLFLQQLGRGLRLHPDKTSCLVLDFIGQHRDEFRFDHTLPAFTGIPRPALKRAIEDGFPFLPSGCSLQLDHVARTQILTSLRSSLAGARRLTAELRELSAHTAPPTLARFLDLTGRDLEDIYDAGGWTTLKRHAGLLATTPDADDVDDLSRRLGMLQHIDEPERLRTYRDIVRAAARNDQRPLSDLERRRMTMLESQLHHRGTLRAAEQTATYLATTPAIVDELEELREVLEDRVTLPAQILPVPEWPLALHRHYSRREIAVGVGYVSAGDKSLNLQTGILKLKDTKQELLFVTLDKSSKDFSPTTRYRDYAISTDRFHWETQAGASVTRPSGKRYVDPSNDWRFYLFVRTDPGAAFCFLGPVRYATHEGDRPIAVTWQLETPMPASLFERYATLRPT